MNASEGESQIAAQAAIAATLTCPCTFYDGRWFYCGAHAARLDPSDPDRDVLWLLLACLALIAGFTAGAAVWAL